MFKKTSLVLLSIFLVLTMMPFGGMVKHVDAASTYYVSFDGNGATSGSMSKQTMYVGASQNLTKNAFGKSGCSFQGWNTKRDGSGGSFTDGQAVKNLTTVGNTVTLFAQWKNGSSGSNPGGSSGNVTITYNGNGASSGSMSSQSLTNGEGKLNKNRFTKTNASFLGWSTSSTATKPTYYDGEYVTLKASVTLYAVWSGPSNVVVTFNANGGTGNNYSQTMTSGASTFLILNKFIRSGYKFIGWNTDKTAKEALYADGVSVKLTNNTVLYAIWSENTSSNIVITFHPNGGSGSSYTQKPIKGVPTELSVNKFSRSGYTFQGWSTSASATKATYLDKARVTFSGNVTLYAIWKQNASAIKYYKVIFNPNGGKGSMSTQSLANGKGTLAKNKFTKANYTFKGWSTSKNGKVSISNGAGVTIAKDTTLYAVWQGNVVKVKYKANGGKNKMDKPTVETRVGKTVKAKAGSKLSRDYYTFTGWATSKNGKVKYKPGDSITIKKDEDIVLYAVWKRACLSDCAYLVYQKIGKEGMWHQYAAIAKDGHATVSAARKWRKKYNINSSATKVSQLNAKKYFIMCNRAVSISLQQAGYMKSGAIINHKSLSSATAYAKAFGGVVNGKYYSGKLNKDCVIYHPNKYFKDLDNKYKPKTGAVYVYDSNIGVYDGKNNEILACYNEKKRYTTKNVVASYGGTCYTNKIRIVIIPKY